jgi:hypothetical protein
MKSLSFTIAAMAISGWLASIPVTAQERGAAPPPQLHAVNPSLSLSAPTDSPIQEQMREDYATGLRAARAVATEPFGLRPAAAGDRPRA